jgi:hypothetical protein
MISIIRELKQVIEEKKISPTTAARFIEVDGRQVYRWLDEEAIPNLSSRKAIRRGLRRIRKNL